MAKALVKKERNFRSRILQYFPMELLVKLYLVSTAHNVNNNDKTPKIVELLKQFNVPFTPLGNGTNRYGILVDGYAVKIALDDAGRMDNRREFRYAKQLDPYVVRVYECLENGLLAVFEYVTIFSYDEYLENQDEMRDILSEISHSYLIGDIGVSQANYVNWGTRQNGQICIMDFAYIYSLSYRGFQCTCEDHGILEFDQDYNTLVCPFCNKKWEFSDIRRRISKADEEKEIGNIMDGPDVRRLTSPDQTFEVEVESETNKKSKDVGPKKMKERTPEEAKAKIEEQRKEITKEPENLEEQAISLVGRDIYEKLIKGYTEKQWGRDCRELPAFIIKRLPVRLTFDNNYFNALYQGIPVGGYTKMVENLLDGIEVRLNTEYLENKEALDALAEKVIYTGPIDAYFGYELGTLEYRSVRFETELLDQENYQGNAAVNYTDRQTPWTRIIEHKWFEFGKDSEGNDIPKTVISREYSSEWKLGDEPYYPVNDEKNGALYARYKKMAEKEENVIFGGRLGEYKYYDMDAVIASSLELCEKELGMKAE